MKLPDHPLQPATGYKREMVDGTALLIRSVCQYCGFAIMGSVLDNLLEDERDHRAQCAAPRTAKGEGAA